jgi:hypothetical protein
MKVNGLKVNSKEVATPGMPKQVLSKGVNSKKELSMAMGKK